MCQTENSVLNTADFKRLIFLNLHFFVFKRHKSRRDYILWENDFETEKKKSAQPSCMMLSTTHRGKDCRLYDIIQNGGKPLLYVVEYDSERPTLPFSVVFSVAQRGKHYYLV